MPCRHLCASEACKKIPKEIEQLVRDIYNYFSNSPKRQKIYLEFQAFVDVEPHRILWPSQTRWLSLHQCVHRIVEQWEALRSYFLSSDENDRLLSVHLKSSRITYCEVLFPLFG